MIPTLASLSMVAPASTPSVDSLSKPKSGSAEFYSASEALKLQSGEEGLDMRPYLFDKNSKEHILMDSGSQVCAWPPEPGDRVDPEMKLKAVNGSQLKCYGYKDVKVRINRKEYGIRAIKTDVQSPILGWNFTRKHRLWTGWNQWGDVILTDPKAKIETILKYKSLTQNQTHKLSVIQKCSQESEKSSHQLAFEVASVEALEEKDTKINNDINQIPEGEYKELLKKFPGLLEMDFKTEDPKNKIIHRIKTGDAEPCRAKVRRYPPGSDKAVKGKEAIDELVKLGILEPVDPSKPNHWSSPVHFTRKSNGSLRTVGDFKLLNKKTILDVYPLPNLRDFTNDINGSKVFSKVDMTKAFHQILIDKRDRGKTCITTPWGMFNFRRLAMGLQNSAQSFQRLVDSVLRGVKDCFVYLDDILVFSKSKKDHLKTLEEIFTRLDKAGLTLALDKCEFGKPNLQYLGFEISKEGISPIPAKVEALDRFPVPTKQKQLLAFLGALNYYRASLPFLPPKGVHTKDRTPAQVLEPLYKLATCDLPKKTKFEEVWENSESVKEAFEDAKTLLKNAITINYPDPGAPLAITTDASKLALGATLDQWVRGAWRPLGMWSKSLKPQQQNYTTYRRELMAVQLAMRHFNHQFNGRRLIIYSDHKPLVGSFASNDLQSHDPLAQNAISEISQWTSDIRHKAGRDIPVADLFSRPQGTHPELGQTQPKDHSASRQERGLHPGQERGLHPGQERGIHLGRERGLYPGQERGLTSGQERDLQDTLSQNPHPGYLAKGPLITNEMFEKADWPEILKIPSEDVKYVPPEETMAALEHVALQTLSPASLALEQTRDPDVLAHQEGHMPKNVEVGKVRMHGVDLLCEISDKSNPRPLLPASQRDLVINLFHHGDHPGAKETIRRTASEYYWPKMRSNITEFVRSCHPCQLAKQSRTVDPGVGDFPVPDKRFEVIHLDIVGPLPESHGHKYLLTIYDRCSRWTEAFALQRDSAEEVAKGFLQYVSRFGLPSQAVSDNGNAFVANLFQDILKTFGVKVRFSPAYHPATNGAVERKHQDIKNALKAALVAMGQDHKDQWFMALPWVMLGLRVKYQPNLDASAAQMVLQMSPKIPGQLVGDSGPPLNSSQSRALLDQLYRLADRPPIPTSGKRVFKDISETEDATHVYVKVDNPLSLCPKFEGPYRIISRPSRSTVELKLGMFKNGAVRSQVYHWTSCKVAAMRDQAVEAERPRLGRPPKPATNYEVLTKPEEDPETQEEVVQPEQNLINAAPKPQPSIQQSGNLGGTSRTRQARTTRNPNPMYK